MQVRLDVEYSVYYFGFKACRFHFVLAGQSHPWEGSSEPGGGV